MRDGLMRDGPMRRRLAGVLLTMVLMLAGSRVARAEPIVVTTTPDLKSIAEMVSGGAVRVETLVPPGVDAEGFEPKPSHLALVRDASLVVRIGLGYDDWLERLLAQSGNARVRPGSDGVLDLSKHMALLEVQGRSVEAQSGHAHGAANPHYWLDPANGEIIGAVIAEALVRLGPQDRDAIAAAQERFATALKERVARWTSTLEPHRGAPLVTYHNSWPYLARRFRLNIVDVIEPKEGVPSSPARLAALGATMRTAKVGLILQEPFGPGEASQFLAGRTGAKVVVLAPSVGSLPGAGDYLSLFDRNVALLAEALAGER